MGLVSDRANLPRILPGKFFRRQTSVVVSTPGRPNGDFIFADVQPGTFTVVITAPGYKEPRRLTNYVAGWAQILHGSDAGNAPKVNYYLPGDTNFDTALFKNIPIENKFVVQFRLEAYNTFNHAEFNSLNNTATFKDASSAANPQTDATFGQ
jgi:hypothetical protein